MILVSTRDSDLSACLRLSGLARGWPDPWIDRNFAMQASKQASRDPMDFLCSLDWNFYFPFALEDIICSNDVYVLEKI